VSVVASWKRVGIRLIAASSLLCFPSRQQIGSTRTGIAPATERGYRLAISQLTKDFGTQLLCDIRSGDLAAFQTRRKREGVSNRTVNLEVGVLRSILRRFRMWEAIATDVDFLEESAAPGRALTHEEETALFDAPAKSRCRSLYPVIMLAINTGCVQARFATSHGHKWTSLQMRSPCASRRRWLAPDA
jgi:hypothetical protein